MKEICTDFVAAAGADEQRAAMTAVQAARDADMLVPTTETHWTHRSETGAAVHAAQQYIRERNQAQKRSADNGKKNITNKH